LCFSCNNIKIFYKFYFLKYLETVKVKKYDIYDKIFVMKKILILLTLLSLALTTIYADADRNMTAEEELYYTKAKEILDSLTPQHGEIKLPNGVATLTVPKEFYYLDANDTEKVLTTLWGNPAGTPMQGMLFPEGKSPMDSDGWGVTIDYEEDGYVEDDEADEIDYTELLGTMQESVKEANQQRVSLGYEPIELVGWASQPFYDKNTHKLHWAKELKFGNQETNTLNYNIRILGRKGVLVLNFVAGMNQLEMINSKVDTVLAMSNFDEGSQYSDFDPSMDEVAAYGIGALIAGKLIAKTGILVTLLLLLKKFWFVVIMAIGALFGRKKSNKEE
jgi:uncharacterized membrane-anchored protein